MATRITEGGGRGVGGSMGSKRVKVSPNVTVVAPKGKKISSAEEARLKNINKPVVKLKPKYQAKADKAEAKIMKAASKRKPKYDSPTLVNVSSKFDPWGTMTKSTARKDAIAEVAARNASAAALVKRRAEAASRAELIRRGY